MASSSETVPLPMLTGDNYESWQMRIMAVLEAKGLESVVYGQETAPDGHVLALASQVKTDLNKDQVETAASKIGSFKTKDASARMFLMSSLSDKYTKIIRPHKHSARAIWDAIKREHEDQDPVTVDALLHEFHSYKMDPKSTISDYVGGIESMVVKLRDMGKVQEEGAVVARLCAGLPSQYSTVVKAWNMIPAMFKTKSLLIKNLKIEEKELKASGLIKGSSSNEGAAMKAEVSRTKSDQDKSNYFKKNKKNVECFYCHKKGHLKKECRKMKSDEASKGNVKAFAVVAKSKGVNSQKWLYDSGASFHMSGNIDWFENYESHNDKIPIQVGNNEYLYSLGTGTIRAISKVGSKTIPIVIESAHYVPGITENLFSQGAADEKGIKSVAENGKLMLMSGDDIIIVGDKGQGNLYTLSLEIPMSAKVARAERTLDEWHRVLGHPDINELKHLANQDFAKDLKIVEKSSNNDKCPDCQLGKAHRSSHPVSERPRATEVLERVHADLVGPISPETLGGSKYFMLIKDEFTSYICVYFMSHKTQVVQALKKYFNDAAIRTQRQVKILRTDNGSEFRNALVEQLCDREGVLQEFSAPYVPEQNGEAERANRTIIETARSMLQSSGSPLPLWGEAVLTAVYLRNRITNKRNRDKTPFELFHGRSPTYSHLVEFGKQCQILINGQNLSKFDAKTKNAYIVGYGDRSNTYRCYVPDKNSITITCDVILAPHKTTDVPHKETNVGAQTTILIGDGFDTRSRDNRSLEQRIAHQTNDILVEKAAPQRIELDEEVTSHKQDGVQVSSVTSNHHNLAIDLPEMNRENVHEQCACDQEPIVETAAVNVDKSLPSTTDEPQQMNRTFDVQQIGSSSRTPPVNNQTPSVANRMITSTPAKVAVFPRNERGHVVLQRPQRSHTMWIPAGNAVARPTIRPTAPVQPAPKQGPSLVKRAESFASRLTPILSGWGLAKDREKRTNIRPPAKNLMASSCINEPTCYSDALGSEDADMWSAAIKEELEAHNANKTWSIVEKKGSEKEISGRWVFKLKLYADGSIERYKARLVARGYTQKQGVDFHEVFSPVVRMDSVRLLFSIAAQFNLKFKQFDIATAFLHGEVSEELYLKPPEGLDVPDGYTCKLNKSLYGLRQAPRCWNEKFAGMLKSFNMKSTHSDPCVYVARDSILYLALYVDDGLIFSDDDSKVDKLLTYLRDHFKIKDIQSSCFIGIEIDKRSDGSILLHQRGYITRMLNKFNMADSKPAPTPLEVGHELNKETTLNGEIINDVPYAEAIGSLLYCAVATRPDLSYALSVLSKYNANPRKEHWTAVKRVFRYLRGSTGQGLLYKQVDHPRVICYTDADWAGDHEKRRSTSGLATFLNTAAISFKAQQQSVVAISTTEAELMASTLAVVDLIWIDRFLTELKISLKEKPLLLIDNQSALKLIKNPEFHPRTKHIDIRYYFAREKYEEKLFELEYVSSEKQKADMFTKPLTVEKFRQLCSTIGCFEPP